MIKNVLITGGCGFIGSHLAESYHKDGHRIVIIDNLSSGNEMNIMGIRLSSVNPCFRFVKDDIGTCDLVDLMKGHAIDIVHHVAARPRVGYSVDFPVESNEENISNTVKVLEAAHKAGVKRVVYSASSSAYGDARYFPTPETRAGHVRSPYALQKRVGEEYCELFSELKGLDTVSLRYFNVFGPRSTAESQYSAVIPIFIEQIIEGRPITIDGDGGQSRDFTYVDNVVQANRLAAAYMGRLDGCVFNVGCGQSHSILHIVGELQALLDKQVAAEFRDPRPGDVKKTHACLERIKAVLQYEPTVGLSEGLSKTVEWYKYYLEHWKGKV